jgi:hypothetical protein
MFCGVYISYLFGLISAKATGSFPPGFFNGIGMSHNTVSSGDHSGSGMNGIQANHTNNVITEKVSTSSTSRVFWLNECLVSLI